MARKQYKPTDFRNKAEFGAYESVPNQFTGVSVPKFVPKFTLHYACATQNRWSGEKAEEYDQIIADCATMTDQTERYAKFAEAEKILMDESPILPLYYRKSQLLVGTNVAKAVNDTLGHTLLMYTELS